MVLRRVGSWVGRRIVKSLRKKAVGVGFLLLSPFLISLDIVYVLARAGGRLALGQGRSGVEEEWSRFTSRWGHWVRKYVFSGARGLSGLD